MQDYWLPTPLACFPFTSPPVRHRVPSHFNWSLPPMFLQSIHNSTNALSDKPFMTCINCYMFRHRIAILRRVIATKVDFVSLCAVVMFYCSGPSLRILLPPSLPPTLAPPHTTNDLTKILRTVSDKVRRLISKQQIHVVLVI